MKPSWHHQITLGFVFLFWFCDFRVSKTPQPGPFLECKCSEKFRRSSACAGLVCNPECQAIALLRLTSPLWSTFCFHFLHISQLCSLWSTSFLTPPSNSFSRLHRTLSHSTKLNVQFLFHQLCKLRCDIQIFLPCVILSITFSKTSNIF